MTAPLALDLAAFAAAAERIASRIRRTPTLSLVDDVPPRPADRACAEPAHLKLECLQVTGAFKARGALHAALRRSADERARGLVTASGGNHGLGVAFAAHALGVAATVVLPANAPEDKAIALRQWGAHVIRHGALWDDADAHARRLAEDEGLAYIHAFADPDVLLGQGTIALEWLADAPDTDTLVIPIGGGGLIGGVACAAKQLRPSLRVIGVEPTGAPTMLRALEAGAVVHLDEVNTAANTLAPRATDAVNLALVEQYVDAIVLVTDAQMHEAARWLWDRAGVAAELSGAAASAAVREGSVRGDCVGAIVCGRGNAAWAS